MNADQSTTSRKPNLVYILADDMGVGDVACLDQRCAWATPRLDALAKDGMAFSDAHSSSAVCTPSRYSILTGRYAWRSWLKRGVTVGASAGLLDHGQTTMASMLHDAEYRTACIGKWHMGWEWACKKGQEIPLRDPLRNRYDGQSVDWIDFEQEIQDGPLAFGFDEYFGISASLDMPPYVYVEGNRPQTTPTSWGTAKDFFRQGPRQEDLLPHTVLGTLTERACDFIHQQGAQDDETSTGNTPFFLYLALTAPHTPIAPAPEFIGSSGVSSYGDLCQEVDYRVGQVCDALAANGLDENTLVIFTSDNGCSGKQAECDILEQRFAHYSSSHYRGYKSDIWDGGHRVPFIARWPEHIRASSSCSQPMGIFDIYATMADIIGHQLAPNEAVDSCSFYTALNGDGFERAADLVHHSIDGRFAIRSGPWKLCRCPGSGGWTLPDHLATEQGLPPIQLYHMDEDLGELNNHLDTNPELVQKLTQQLHQLVCNGSSRPGAASLNDPEIPLEQWEQVDWRAELPESMILDD